MPFCNDCHLPYPLLGKEGLCSVCRDRHWVEGLLDGLDQEDVKQQRPRYEAGLWKALSSELGVTEEQFQEVAEKFAEEGGAFPDTLIEMGLVTEDDVLYLLQQGHLLARADLDDQIAPEVLSLIPKDVARDLKVIPVEVLGPVLTLAMVNPMDVEAVGQIEGLTEFMVLVAFCTYTEFEVAFSRYYD